MILTTTAPDTPTFGAKDIWSNVDQICDHIPVIGQINNLMALFQKCLVIPLLRKKTASNHYYTYLQQKSCMRCIILLIPIIGSLAVDIYDALHDPVPLTVSLQDILRENESLRNNRDFMLWALRQQICVTLEYASASLKNDKEFMLRALQKHVCIALEHASAELKNDKEFMLEALYRNFLAALEHANVGLKNDKDFMLQALRMDSATALAYATEELKNDADFMFRALKRNSSVALRHIGTKLKNNRNFMLQARQCCDEQVFLQYAPPFLKKELGKAAG